MSDGSNPSTKIQSEPLRNIGAQDILKIEGKTYDGGIRKRGKWDKFLGSTKWKQRYVVISQGCLYCFRDEYAQRPVTAFSLSIYSRVSEVEYGDVLNCFEIIHIDETKPSHFFSCETDDKRKIWIDAIKAGMTRAHGHNETKSSNDSDEGICMSPTASTKRRSRAKLPPVPAVPTASSSGDRLNSKSEFDFDQSDEEGSKADEEYDTVRDVDEICRRDFAGQVPVLPVTGKNRPTSQARREPMPLPGQRRPSDASSSRAQLPTPPNETEKPQPDYLNENIFQRDEYFLDSSDREEVKRLLTGRPPGTFLVRRGNSTPTVLCVMTSQGNKDFSIFEQDSKVSLNRTVFFPSLDAMLCFYNQNYLPKKEYNVKLDKGYNVV